MAEEGIFVLGTLDLSTWECKYADCIRGMLLRGERSENENKTFSANKILL